MALEFHNICPEMKDTVNAYVRANKIEGSEHTFTNLLMWGTDGRIRVAENGHALYVMLFDTQPCYMFAPLLLEASGDYDRAVCCAEEHFDKINVKPLFKAISGSFVELFRKNGGYSLIEDRDNYDYVYTSESLITLSGKKLHAKRNHINQFNTLYSSEYIELNETMLPECEDVFDRWIKAKGEHSTADAMELRAIREIVPHMSYLGVKGGGIRIDGQLVAFSLGERIDGDMAVIHIEKALGEYTGLYAVINQQFVAHEFSDVRLINREEDMGLEGLRKAKLSYNPVTLLEKFTGVPRCGD